MYLKDKENKVNDKKTIYMVINSYNYVGKFTEPRIKSVFNNRNDAINYVLSFMYDDHLLECNEDNCRKCNDYTHVRKHMDKGNYEHSFYEIMEMLL